MVGLSAAFPATSLTQISATVSEDITANQIASINRTGLFNANSLYSTQTLDGSPSAGDGTAVASGNGKICTARRDGSTIQVDIHTIDADGTYSATATDTYSASSIPIVHHLSDDKFWLINDNVVRVVELSGGSLNIGSSVTGTALNPAGSDYHASGFIGTTFLRLGVAGDVANTAYKYTVSGTTVTETALTYDVSSMTSSVTSVKGTCETGSSLLVLTRASIGGTNSTQFTRFTLSGNTLTLASEYTAADTTTNQQITISTPVMLIPSSTAGSFVILYDDNNEVQARVCSGYGSTIGSKISISDGTGVKPVGGYFHPNQSTYAVLYIDTVDAVTSLYVKELTSSAAGTAVLLQSGVATGSTGAQAQGWINSATFETTNDFFFATLDDVTNGLILEKFKDSIPFYKIGVFKDSVSSGSEATIHIRRPLMGILSEEYSGLTRGTNYYLGNTGITTISTDNPFIGWAVDTDSIVISENALS
jgi:hypothetical protein